MRKVLYISGVMIITTLLITSIATVPVSPTQAEPTQVGNNVFLDDSQIEPLLIEPKYGGVLSLSKPMALTHFDDAAGFSVMQAPTLALTNEDLLMGDWTKGAAGTGDTTWIYSMMPTFGTLYGCLAESFCFPDEATIIFDIRHGVHFHNKPPTNGREINANDVVFSLIRLWQTPTSYHYNVLPWATHIQSISVLDNWTVEIRCLPGKLATVYEWASCASKIVPPEVIAQYGDMEDWTNSCGTGPFILTDYVSGASVTFTRNPNYWGYDPLYPENQLPYLDGVKWYIIPDLSTRIAALRSGKIDVLENISWNDAQSLMITDPELQWKEYPRGTTDSLFMRVDGPLFNDIRVRKALALAVDNLAIRNDYYDGHANILAWPIMPTPEFIDMYTPLGALPPSVQELYGYNPAKAIQLLDNAGYSDGFMTNVVCTSGHVDILSIIKEYWADVGVDLEITVYETGAWLSIGMSKTYDQMYMFGTNSIQPFSFTNLAPGNVFNFSMVNDPVINNVYQAINDSYFNEPLKRQLMKDVVPYILDQSYILVPPMPHSFTAWQPWVKGYSGEYTVGYIGATGNFPKYISLASLVDLSIQPAGQTVAVGDTFSVTVRAEAGSQTVTGVSAYLNFDPAYLEVQSITPGAALPTVIENNYNNTAGTINYSAGKMGEPFPSGTFDVATIQFKALELTSPSTALIFSTTAPRETMVDFGGSDVTGTLSGGTVTVANTLVDISMLLQGGSRPDPEGWEIPVAVKFFSPGADVLNDTPIAEFNMITTKSGSTAVCQCSIAPGIYDVTVEAKNCHYCEIGNCTLMNVKRDVNISLPLTSVNMGTLLAGDANCDGIINISDFGILAVSFGKMVGEPGFDCRNDFDCNGIINISDFGLLAVNFLKMSPVQVSGP